MPRDPVRWGSIRRQLRDPRPELELTSDGVHCGRRARERLTPDRGLRCAVTPVSGAPFYADLTYDEQNINFEYEIN